MNGFLCIDKPPGPSSFAVVKRLKHLLGQQKAGHAGTLDPAASGLLLLAFNSATRLIQFIPTEPKTYEFTIQFGSETDTLDDTGKIIQTNGRLPRRGEVQAALGRFTGSIEQEPPQFSAVKIAGERAYTRARRNEQFTVRKKNVFIHSLALLDFSESLGQAACSTVCSTGTYIRSLARDIAQSLGTYGYTRSIKRTVMGSFSLDQAIAFDAVSPDSIHKVISITDAVLGMPQVTVDENSARQLLQGLDITLNYAMKDNEPVFIFDMSKELIAVVEKVTDNRAHPIRVFSP